MLRFISGLLRTKQQFTSRIAQLFSGRKAIDPALLTELEEILITSDVGSETSKQIIQHLHTEVKKLKINDPAALEQELQKYLQQLLLPCESNLIIDSTHKPFVIMLIGVNGAGKTTTIGKLTKFLQKSGKRVMLAAADTFRAAAIEQLIAWGQTNDVPVISQHSGADSASVCYDALQAAKARNYDVLLVDTAGRLHTQGHLMEELKKIKRIMQKLDASAPQEIMLVLDASIGQNALQQAHLFNEALGLTGLVITKLDGTAKGGVIFAIANKLRIPIRYIGVGEKTDDLEHFNAENFVKSLFSEQV